MYSTLLYISPCCYFIQLPSPGQAGRSQSTVKFVDSADASTLDRAHALALPYQPYSDVDSGYTTTPESPLASYGHRRENYSSLASPVDPIEMDSSSGLRTGVSEELQACHSGVKLDEVNRDLFTSMSDDTGMFLSTSTLRTDRMSGSFCAMSDGDGYDYDNDAFGEGRYGEMFYAMATDELEAHLTTDSTSYVHTDKSSGEFRESRASSSVDDGSTELPKSFSSFSGISSSVDDLSQLPTGSFDGTFRLKYRGGNPRSTRYHSNPETTRQTLNELLPNLNSQRTLHEDTMSTSVDDITFDPPPLSISCSDDEFFRSVLRHRSNSNSIRAAGVPTFSSSVDHIPSLLTSTITARGERSLYSVKMKGSSVDDISHKDFSDGDPVDPGADELDIFHGTYLDQRIVEGHMLESSEFTCSSSVDDPLITASKAFPGSEKASGSQARVPQHKPSRLREKCGPLLVCQNHTENSGTQANPNVKSSTSSSDGSERLRRNVCVHNSGFTTGLALLNAHRLNTSSASSYCLQRLVSVTRGYNQDTNRSGELSKIKTKQQHLIVPLVLDLRPHPAIDCRKPLEVIVSPRSRAVNVACDRIEREAAATPEAIVYVTIHHSPDLITAYHSTETKEDLTLEDHDALTIHAPHIPNSPDIAHEENSRVSCEMSALQEDAMVAKEQLLLSSDNIGLADGAGTIICTERTVPAIQLDLSESRIDSVQKDNIYHERDATTPVFLVQDFVNDTSQVLDVDEIERSVAQEADSVKAVMDAKVIKIPNLKSYYDSVPSCAIETPVWLVTCSEAIDCLDLPAHAHDLSNRPVTPEAVLDDEISQTPCSLQEVTRSLPAFSMSFSEETDIELGSDSLISATLDYDIEGHEDDITFLAYQEQSEQLPLSQTMAHQRSSEDFLPPKKSEADLTTEIENIPIGLQETLQMYDWFDSLVAHGEESRSSLPESAEPSAEGYESSEIKINEFDVEPVSISGLVETLEDQRLIEPDNLLSDEIVVEDSFEESYIKTNEWLPTISDCLEQEQTICFASESLERPHSPEAMDHDFIKPILENNRQELGVPEKAQLQTFDFTESFTEEAEIDFGESSESLSNQSTNIDWFDHEAGEESEYQGTTIEVLEDVSEYYQPPKDSEADLTTEIENIPIGLQETLQMYDWFDSLVEHEEESKSSLPESAEPSAEGCESSDIKINEFEVEPVSISGLVESNRSQTDQELSGADNRLELEEDLFEITNITTNEWLPTVSDSLEKEQKTGHASESLERPRSPEAMDDEFIRPIVEKNGEELGLLEESHQQTLKFTESFTDDAEIDFGESAKSIPSLSMPYLVRSKEFQLPKDSEDDMANDIEKIPIGLQETLLMYDWFDSLVEHGEESKSSLPESAEPSAEGYDSSDIKINEFEVEPVSISGLVETLTDPRLVEPDNLRSDEILVEDPFEESYIKTNEWLPTISDSLEQEHTICFASESLERPHSPEAMDDDFIKPILEKNRQELGVPEKPQPHTSDFAESFTEEAEIDFGESSESLSNQSTNIDWFDHEAGEESEYQGTTIEVLADASEYYQPPKDSEANLTTEIENIPIGLQETLQMYDWFDSLVAHGEESRSSLPESAEPSAEGYESSEIKINEFDVEPVSISGLVETLADQRLIEPDNLLSDEIVVEDSFEESYIKTNEWLPTISDCLELEQTICFASESLERPHSPEAMDDDFIKPILEKNRQELGVPEKAQPHTSDFAESFTEEAEIDFGESSESLSNQSTNIDWFDHEAGEESVYQGTTIEVLADASEYFQSPKDSEANLTTEIENIPIGLQETLQMYDWFDSLVAHGEESRSSLPESAEPSAEGYESSEIKINEFDVEPVSISGLVETLADQRLIEPDNLLSDEIVVEDSFEESYIKTNEWLPTISDCLELEQTIFFASESLERPHSPEAMDDDFIKPILENNRQELGVPEKAQPQTFDFTESFTEEAEIDFGESSESLSNQSTNIDWFDHEAGEESEYQGTTIEVLPDATEYFQPPKDLETDLTTEIENIPIGLQETLQMYDWFDSLVEHGEESKSILPESAEPSAEGYESSDIKINEFDVEPVSISGLVESNRSQADQELSGADNRLELDEDLFEITNITTNEWLPTVSDSLEKEQKTGRASESLERPRSPEAMDDGFIRPIVEKNGEELGLLEESHQQTLKFTESFTDDAEIDFGESAKSILSLSMPYLVKSKEFQLPKDSEDDMANDIEKCPIGLQETLLMYDWFDSLVEHVKESKSSLSESAEPSAEGYESSDIKINEFEVEPVSISGLVESNRSQADQELSGADNRLELDEDLFEITNITTNEWLPTVSDSLEKEQKTGRASESLERPRSPEAMDDEFIRPIVEKNGEELGLLEESHQQTLKFTESFTDDAEIDFGESAKSISSLSMPYLVKSKEFQLPKDSEDDMANDIEKCPIGLQETLLMYDWFDSLVEHVKESKSSLSESAEPSAEGYESSDIKINEFEVEPVSISGLVESNRSQADQELSGADNRLELDEDLFEITNITTNEWLPTVSDSLEKEQKTGRASESLERPRSPEAMDDEFIRPIVEKNGEELGLLEESHQQTLKFTESFTDDAEIDFGESAKSISSLSMPYLVKSKEFQLPKDSEDDMANDIEKCPIGLQETLLMYDWFDSLVEHVKESKSSLSESAEPSAEGYESSDIKINEFEVEPVSISGLVETLADQRLVEPDNLRSDEIVVEDSFEESNIKTIEWLPTSSDSLEQEQTIQFASESLERPHSPEAMDDDFIKPILENNRQELGVPEKAQPQTFDFAESFTEEAEIDFGERSEPLSNQTMNIDWFDHEAGEESEYQGTTIEVLAGASQDFQPPKDTEADLTTEIKNIPIGLQETLQMYDWFDSLAEHVKESKSSLSESAEPSAEGYESSDIKINEFEVEPVSISGLVETLTDQRLVEPDNLRSDEIVVEDSFEESYIKTNEWLPTISDSLEREHTICFASESLERPHSPEAMDDDFIKPILEKNRQELGVPEKAQPHTSDFAESFTEEAEIDFGESSESLSNQSTNIDWFDHEAGEESEYQGTTIEVLADASEYFQPPKDSEANLTTEIENIPIGLQETLQMYDWFDSLVAHGEESRSSLPESAEPSAEGYESSEIKINEFDVEPVSISGLVETLADQRLIEPDNLLSDEIVVEDSFEESYIKTNEWLPTISDCLEQEQTICFASESLERPHSPEAMDDDFIKPILEKNRQELGVPEKAQPHTSDFAENFTEEAEIDFGESSESLSNQSTNIDWFDHEAGEESEYQGTTIEVLADPSEYFQPLKDSEDNLTTEIENIPIGLQETLQMYDWFDSLVAHGEESRSILPVRAEPSAEGYESSDIKINEFDVEPVSISGLVETLADQRLIEPDNLLSDEIVVEDSFEESYIKTNEWLPTISDCLEQEETICFASESLERPHSPEAMDDDFIKPILENNRQELGVPEKAQPQTFDFTESFTEEAEIDFGESSESLSNQTMNIDWFDHEAGEESEYQGTTIEVLADASQDFQPPKDTEADLTTEIENIPIGLQETLQMYDWFDSLVEHGEESKSSLPESAEPSAEGYESSDIEINEFDVEPVSISGLVQLNQSQADQELFEGDNELELEEDSFEITNITTNECLLTVSDSLKQEQKTCFFSESPERPGSPEVLDDEFIKPIVERNRQDLGLLEESQPQPLEFKESFTDDAEIDFGESVIFSLDESMNVDWFDHEPTDGENQGMDKLVVTSEYDPEAIVIDLSAVESVTPTVHVDSPDSLGSDLENVSDGIIMLDSTYMNDLVAHTDIIQQSNTSQSMNSPGNARVYSHSEDLENEIMKISIGLHETLQIYDWYDSLYEHGVDIKVSLKDTADCDGVDYESSHIKINELEPVSIGVLPQPEQSETRQKVQRPDELLKVEEVIGTESCRDSSIETSNWLSTVSDIVEQERMADFASDSLERPLSPEALDDGFIKPIFQNNVRELGLPVSKEQNNVEFSKSFGTDNDIDFGHELESLPIDISETLLMYDWFDSLVDEDENSASLWADCDGEQYKPSHIKINTSDLESVSLSAITGSHQSKPESSTESQLTEATDGESILAMDPLEESNIKMHDCILTASDSIEQEQTADFSSESLDRPCSPEAMDNEFIMPILNKNIQELGDPHETKCAEVVDFPNSFSTESDIDFSEECGTHSIDTAKQSEESVVDLKQGKKSGLNDRLFTVSHSFEYVPATEIALSSSKELYSPQEMNIDFDENIQDVKDNKVDSNRNDQDFVHSYSESSKQDDIERCLARVSVSLHDTLQIYDWFDSLCERDGSRKGTDGAEGVSAGCEPSNIEIDSATIEHGSLGVSQGLGSFNSNDKTIDTGDAILDSLLTVSDSVEMERESDFAWASLVGPETPDLMDEHFSHPILEKNLQELSVLGTEQEKVMNSESNFYEDLVVDLQAVHVGLYETLQIYDWFDSLLDGKPSEPEQDTVTQETYEPTKINISGIEIDPSPVSPTPENLSYQINDRNLQGVPTGSKGVEFGEKMEPGTGPIFGADSADPNQAIKVVNWLYTASDGESKAVREVYPFDSVLDSARGADTVFVAATESESVRADRGGTVTNVDINSCNTALAAQRDGYHDMIEALGIMEETPQSESHLSRERHHPSTSSIGSAEVRDEETAKVFEAFGILHFPSPLTPSALLVRPESPLSTAECSDYITEENQDRVLAKGLPKFEESFDWDADVEFGAFDTLQEHSRADSPESDVVGEPSEAQDTETGNIEKQLQAFPGDDQPGGSEKSETGQGSLGSPDQDSTRQEYGSHTGQGDPLQEQAQASEGNTKYLYS